MQRANSTLKLAAVAALIAHGAFAAAQVGAVIAPPGIGPQPGAPVAINQAPAAFQAPGQGAAPATTAAAVKAVAIGKADDLPAGTLKELESLQREAYISELRAKIRTQAANSEKPVAVAAPAASPFATPATAQGVNLAAAPTSQWNQSAGAQATQPAQPYAGNPYPGLAMNAPAPESTAMLVSVIVSGGRARADVMYDGIIKTVKEGDKLGDWSVASIVPTGVTVQKQVVEPPHGPAPKAKPLSKGAKFAVVVPVEVPAGGARVITSTLKPYIPPAPVPTAGAAAGGVQSAVVPPLPAQIRYPDSASIGAASPMATR